MIERHKNYLSEIKSVLNRIHEPNFSSCFIHLKLSKSSNFFYVIKLFFVSGKIQRTKSNPNFFFKFLGKF